MTEPTFEAAIEPDVEGLREQHKRRTLQALRQAAVELFLEQGFDRTTVDQIVDHAGVSQRTFFRYFSCKEAVLFGLEFRGRFLDELRRRPCNELPAESLRAAAVATWPLSADTGQMRRSLRQQLIATHPGVRAYALQLADETAQEVAAVIANRLGVDIDSDARPHVCGQLWAALNRWLLHRGSVGTDPTAAIDDFFGAACGLLAGYVSFTGSPPRASTNPDIPNTAASSNAGSG